MKDNRQFEAVSITNQPITHQEERADLERALEAIEEEDVRAISADVGERLVRTRFEPIDSSKSSTRPIVVPGRVAFESPPSEHNERWTDGYTGFRSVQYRRHKLDVGPEVDVPEGRIRWDETVIRSVQPDGFALADRLEHHGETPTEPLAARGEEWLPWTPKTPDAPTGDDRPNIVLDYVVRFDRDEIGGVLAEEKLEPRFNYAIKRTGSFHPLAIAVYRSHAVARVVPNGPGSAVGGPVRFYDEWLHRMGRRNPIGISSSEVTTADGRPVGKLIGEISDDGLLEPAEVTG